MTAVIESYYELRTPRDTEDWTALHEIRRKVLFENRGKHHIYIDNHPDDFRTSHYPLVFLYKGEVIGVIRIEIGETAAWFRRVAIRDDVQRLGHGRVLLRLAEAFAEAKGSMEVRCNAAVDAVGFYERCGYSIDTSAVVPANSVSMGKSLR